MKKFSKYFFAATIVVAATAAILVGCKKEKDEPKDNGLQSEAAVLVNRINNFLELRDAVNSGAKADGSMTVEEMREILCMVSNYEHSEHETYCHNTVLDTLEVRMAPIVNGNVSESDVVAVYNAFETELEGCMESVDDGMDVPSLFSIVLPENGTRDEEDIRIIFTRGQEGDPEPISSPSVSGPFDGICLYWGLNLGRCDGGISVITDAANEMTKCFKFDYSAANGIVIFSNVEYVSYVATDMFSMQHPEWIYWEPEPYLAPCDTWLFNLYGILPDNTPEPCMCEDALNCEYTGIDVNIVSEYGPLHNSPNSHLPYFECVVNGETVLLHPYDKHPIGRVHVANVKYAEYTIHQNQE